MGLHLANDLYLTKLDADYLYLTEKRHEKNLEIESKTGFSWWMFNFGNRESIQLINQHGDLVDRTKKSKMMIGSTLRIWSDVQDTVVERDRLFKHYLRERQAVGSECVKANWLTKVQFKEADYDQNLKECKRRTKVVA